MVAGAVFPALLGSPFLGRQGGFIIGVFDRDEFA